MPPKEIHFDSQKRDYTIKEWGKLCQSERDRIIDIIEIENKLCIKKAFNEIGGTGTLIFDFKGKVLMTIEDEWSHDWNLCKEERKYGIPLLAITKGDSEIEDFDF